ncbi:MAG: uncharacterized protein KVP18_001039 [Porospora cf. gigantea A]|uniref:uncharacterized protein n=1 Tax=Porospora cf. gigantea A TaxID=2853593 RepID=UPI00355A31AC|nr:MAG: hypothetical protein KVP18_001039 [Porospora cf. gigantea A]
MSQREQKFEEIGTQFTQFYFGCFQTQQGRNELAAKMYSAESLMTWNNDKLMGAESIAKKLAALSFQKLAYENITTVYQPGPAGTVTALVTGDMKIDDDLNAVRFLQHFIIAPGANGFYIVNEVFNFM